MLYLTELKKYKLPLETRILLALAEHAQEFGLHFVWLAQDLAVEVHSNEIGVRRVLNDFKLQGLVKINNEIWLNPDVFAGGNRPYEKAYKKQINKREP